MSLKFACNQITVHTHFSRTSQSCLSHELKVKSIASNGYHHSGHVSVVQIRRSQTQLSLGALEITLVEILYTPEIVDPTEKVSTFRLPRLPLLIASRSNDSNSLSPTGSPNVSDMSAITLPFL